MTSSDDTDLLAIDRGIVVSPAGCGKTQLITNAVVRHGSRKPILILTHTNAGVAALRSRLDKAGAARSSYRLATIDGWAIRLISTFPARSGHDPSIVAGQRPNYPAIREAALRLLAARHVSDVIEASYSRMLVDEYQDCSIRQHGIVYYASHVIPVCVVGDPMQAIFGFGNDPLANWEKHVCGHFPLAGELKKPWRWVNAGTEAFGHWLLDVRERLSRGETIDLTALPEEVEHVALDGSNDDRQKQLLACRVKPPGNLGSVLIIGESTSPPSQQRFASQTPGAVTVESVDLRDLVNFARVFELNGADALERLARFAQSVMTNVGVPDLLQRVESIMRGTARREPSDAERAAITFLEARTHGNAADLLVALNRQGGTRVFRPAVLRSCIRALQMCEGHDAPGFYDAAVRVREQNRSLGRSLPRRAVGSTLLLKGLEAEVAVILEADNLSPQNLYVAMTRGSKRLVVCSRNAVLNPH